MEPTFNKLKKALDGNSEALKELDKISKFTTRSIELLMTCSTQVGMMTGADIKELIAEANNEKFNERDYHFERLPEGQ